MEERIIRKCVLCYEDFETQDKRKMCCSKKCKVDRNTILRRWRIARDKKMFEEKPKPKKKVTKKKKETVVDVAAKAKEAGMTYGEYVARTQYGMR